jgi:hypothetical protein
MILFALRSVLSRSYDYPSVLLGKRCRPVRLPDKEEVDRLRDAVDKATAALLYLLEVRNGKSPLTESSTYGKDDPFTLTWMAEVLFRLPSTPQTEKAFAEHKTLVATTAKSTLERTEFLDTTDSKGDFKEVKSSFLKLRRLHLSKTLAGFGNSFFNAAAWIESVTLKYWTDFEAEIHRQLSYAAMGDSRFDPSELAFAFEGALLLHPTWVSPATVDKVFESLRLSTERQPFWRPVTPLIANDRGHVLFLISIEVANSILRSCEILDETDPRLRRFSQIEGQLRTYTTWLLGELEEIIDEESGRRRFVGWRSEYEEKTDRDTIYLWYTSHVLVFLLHYHSLLKAKIGSDGAHAAGLLVKQVSRAIPSYWADEPLRSIVSKRYEVLSTIEEQFVRRRENADQREAPPQSMILYGPPGTGKTTLAEQLAATLRRPLIVVTVSDFLAAGAAEIENRAKGVFEILRAQDDVVVLFDEIDQFLLDRNSKLYKDQDDVFKFMTPGMLTKLQDLRKAENCIFIISTNYYERIDSAIKRLGRIDAHFLLSLPDKNQRRALFTRFVSRQLGSTLDAAQDADFQAALDANKVLETSALFSYSDIWNLVNVRSSIEPKMKVTEIARTLADSAKELAPATSLSAYSSRFGGDSQSPYEEFFLLVYLLGESGKARSDSDNDALYRALDGVRGLIDVDTFDFLKGYVEDSALFEALSVRKSEILKGWVPAKKI